MKRFQNFLIENKYGNIDLTHTDTKEDPENPMVLVLGYGKLRFETLKKIVRQEIEKLNKDIGKDNLRHWEFLYNTYSGKTGNLLSNIGAIIDVYNQMNTAQYKRKITLAKRK
jgi:hypothetical protein